jgi:two-component system, NarL family, sensor histidine kinase UhpB
VSLYWRVFAINAILWLVAAVVLAVSPATISDDVLLQELVVLGVGVVLVLVLNFLLVRRTLDPIERLTRVMRNVDLMRPGSRVDHTGGGREVAELSSAFNQMLGRLEHERRDSGRRAIQAQEHERRRIALELHDEVGQLLTGVVLGLDAVATSVPERERERVEGMQQMVRTGAEHVREIARGLRPESLEELGLRSALIGLTSSVADRASLRIERRIGTDLPTLPPDVELVVYRVAQESLTNVVRHADAARVTVALERTDDGALELRVADDGKGIDPADLRAGRGLSGMLERALYVGGEFEIRQSPRGAGTEVVLRVPVSHNGTRQ